MNWIDIASIVFVCVTANHLGLIGKIEEIMGELPILNCPKCCSFWAVLSYGMFKLTEIGEFIPILAISFLASYCALWLELLEGYIDTLYLKLYEKIITAGNDDTAPAVAGDGDTPGPVSEL